MCVCVCKKLKCTLLFFIWGEKLKPVQNQNKGHRGRWLAEATVISVDTSLLCTSSIHSTFRTSSVFLHPTCTMLNINILVQPVACMHTHTLFGVCFFLKIILHSSLSLIARAKFVSSSSVFCLWTPKTQAYNDSGEKKIAEITQSLGESNYEHKVHLS